MINKFKHFNKSLKLSTVDSFAFIKYEIINQNKKDCTSLWKSTSAGNGCLLKGHHCTGKLLLEGSCKF